MKASKYGWYANVAEERVDQEGLGETSRAADESKRGGEEKPN
jgi:hypothetical protein